MYVVMSVSDVTPEIQAATNFDRADRSLDGTKILLKIMTGNVPAGLTKISAQEAREILRGEEWSNDIP